MKGKCSQKKKKNQPKWKKAKCSTISARQPVRTGTIGQGLTSYVGNDKWNEMVTKPQNAVDRRHRKPRTSCTDFKFRFLGLNFGITTAPFSTLFLQKEIQCSKQFVMTHEFQLHKMWIIYIAEYFKKQPVGVFVVQKNAGFLWYSLSLFILIERLGMI